MFIVYLTYKRKRNSRKNDTLADDIDKLRKESIHIFRLNNGNVFVQLAQFLDVIQF